MAEGVVTKRGRGRPPKKVPKLNTSPEKAARAIFSAVKPPDLKRRVGKRNRAVASYTNGHWP